MRFGLILGAIAVCSATSNAPAQTWNGTPYPASNWSTASNWTGGFPSNNGTANVTFSGSNVTANLDANWNIGTLNLSGSNYAGTVIITGTNTLTIQNGITSSISQSGTPEASLAVNISLPAVQTWDITTSDLPVNGIISGAGGITKTGTGQLTLGTGNTYSGGTIINAGSVWPTDDTSFGNSNGQLQLNGTTLIFKAASTTDTSVLTFSRSIALGSGSATITTKRNLTLASAISGSAALTIARDSSIPYLSLAPLVTLSGNNTFTGGLALSDPLYSTSSIFTWSVVVTGTSQSLGNGPVTVAAGTSLSINSATNIGSGQKITLPSQGTLVVTSDTFNPATIVSATSTQASLLLGSTTYGQPLNLATLGDGTFSLGAQSGQTIYSASTLQPGTGNTYRLGAGGGTLIISGYDDVLTGTASVQVSGAVDLMNANNFSGGISGGTVGIGNDAALGLGAVTIGKLAALNGARTMDNHILLTPSAIAQITGPITFNGTVDLGGGTPAVFALGTGPVVFANVVGNGALNINSGVITLQSTNTFSSLELYEGGAAVASENNLGGASTPIIFDGYNQPTGSGTLETTASFTLNNPISFHRQTNNSGVFQVDPGTTLTLEEAIPSGSIFKTGTGNLIFSSSSSLSGDFYIDAGKATSGGATLANAYVQINAGGSFTGSGTIKWLGLSGGQLTPGGGTGGIVNSLALIASPTYGSNSLQFQFTQKGSPTYSNLANSGNGFLSFPGLNSAATFNGSTTSLFLSTSTVQLGDIFKGAFFLQSTSPVSSTFFSGLGFSTYVLSPSGSTSFNGQNYALLNSGLYSIQQSWVAENGGQVSQFKIVGSLGAPPANASPNMPYSFAFPAIGNPTYSVSSGSLPPGLALSSAGVLSGTPAQAGTYSFGITSSDGSGDNTIQNFTLNVQSSPDLASNTPAMPPWTVAVLGILLLGAAARRLPGKSFSVSG